MQNQFKEYPLKSFVIVVALLAVSFVSWAAEPVSQRAPNVVVFLVDDEPQLSRTRKPWAAELRLPSLPVELTVRAEGYDRKRELVASDELVLNQPRGMLCVGFLVRPPGLPRG